MKLLAPTSPLIPLRREGGKYGSPLRTEGGKRAAQGDVFLALPLFIALLITGCASTGSHKADASKHDAGKPPQEDFKPPEPDLKPKAGSQWEPIVYVPPYYPQKALDKGIQGHVLLKFTVTKTGTVENIVVIDSSPLGYFEWSAIRAAAQFKYKPKTVNGEPIDVPDVQYKIPFILDHLRHIPR